MGESRNNIFTPASGGAGTDDASAKDLKFTKSDTSAMARKAASGPQGLPFHLTCRMCLLHIISPYFWVEIQSHRSQPCPTDQWGPFLSWLIGCTEILAALPLFHLSHIFYATCFTTSGSCGFARGKPSLWVASLIRVYQHTSTFQLQHEKYQLILLGSPSSMMVFCTHIIFTYTTRALTYHRILRTDLDLWVKYSICFVIPPYTNVLYKSVE